MSGNGLRRLDAKAADFDVALESLLRRDDPFDFTVLQIAQGIIADIRDMATPPFANTPRALTTLTFRMQPHSKFPQPLWKLLFKIFPRHCVSPSRWQRRELKIFTSARKRRPGSMMMVAALD